MANAEQLTILKQGVEVWNNWREENPDNNIELDGLDISGANLNNINLRDAYLAQANLSKARFTNANLNKADLMDKSIGFRAIKSRFFLHQRLDCTNLICFVY